MRVAGEMLRKQTDFRNHILDLLNSVGFILKEIEVVKTLGDNIIDGGALVERSGGILEHHLYISDYLAVETARNFA